jgi:hypothetical protein
VLPVASDEPALVAVARLVQEDLCVMVRDDDAWRLRAAVVCFPSRWDLTEKIGRSLDVIHEPVPSFDVALAGPTSKTFDRLTPAKSYWRLNWTLLDDADLYQPRSTRRAPVGELEHWHFRVERQTIRRLAASGAVVFTIRNYVTSLATLAHDDVFLEHVTNAIATAPESVVDYKGWRGVADALREARS